MTSVVITSRTRRIERSFARTEPSAPRRSGPHLHPRTGRSAVREAKVPAIVLPSDHQPGSRIGVLDGAARCCLMPITGSRPQAVLRRVQPRIAAVQPDACRDRKSTRLNSIHEGISYAVFCLIKKKEWVAFLVDDSTDIARCLYTGRRGGC